VRHGGGAQGVVRVGVRMRVRVRVRVRVGVRVRVRVGLRVRVRVRVYDGGPGCEPDIATLLCAAPCGGSVGRGYTFTGATQCRSQVLHSHTCYTVQVLRRSLEGTHTEPPSRTSMPLLEVAAAHGAGRAAPPPATRPPTLHGGEGRVRHGRDQAAI